MYATLVSGDRTLSGDMLEQRVRRVAGGLTALGLVAGDAVGILMRNDFPVFEVALAAERIGVVAVPLNWHGTPEEIGYILADSQARALFAHTDLLRTTVAVVPAHCRVVEVIPPPEVQFAYRLQRSSCTPAPGGLEYEAWVGASAESSCAPMPPPFRLLYTSGTAGLNLIECFEKFPP